MKQLILCLIPLLLFSAATVAQTTKAVVPPVSTSIKMPGARSVELKTLQAQADKLKADYEAAMREIQLRATALITRAALEVRMTIEQLDSMTVDLDGEGNYEWKPLPRAIEKKP